MPRPRCLPLALLAAVLLGLARSPSFALSARRQLLAAAVVPLGATAARAEEESPLGSIPKDGKTCAMEDMDKTKCPLK